MLTIIQPIPAEAQDTNGEIIKQLQKRIEELEQKVKSLETGKEAPQRQEVPSQHVADLEQKVKVLERNRELDAEAAEAKAGAGREKARRCAKEKGEGQG